MALILTLNYWILAVLLGQDPELREEAEGSGDSDSPDVSGLELSGPVSAEASQLSAESLGLESLTLGPVPGQRSSSFTGEEILLAQSTVRERIQDSATSGPTFSDLLRLLDDPATQQQPGVEPSTDPLTTSPAPTLRDLERQLNQELPEGVDVAVQATVEPSFDPVSDVAEIYNALHPGYTGYGTDHRDLANLLRDRTPEQIQQIREQWNEIYGGQESFDGRDFDGVILNENVYVSSGIRRWWSQNRILGDRGLRRREMEILLSGSPETFRDYIQSHNTSGTGGEFRYQHNLEDLSDLQFRRLVSASFALTNPTDESFTSLRESFETLFEGAGERSIDGLANSLRLVSTGIEVETTGSGTTIRSKISETYQIEDTEVDALVSLAQGDRAGFLAGAYLAALESGRIHRVMDELSEVDQLSTEELFRFQDEFQRRSGTRLLLGAEEYFNGDEVTAINMRIELLDETITQERRLDLMASLAASNIARASGNFFGIDRDIVASQFERSQVDPDGVIEDWDAYVDLVDTRLNRHGVSIDRVMTRLGVRHRAKVETLRANGELDEVETVLHAIATDNDGPEALARALAGKTRSEIMELERQLRSPEGQERYGDTIESLESRGMGRVSNQLRTMLAQPLDENAQSPEFFERLTQGKGGRVSSGMRVTLAGRPESIDDIRNLVELETIRSEALDSGIMSFSPWESSREHLVGRLAEFDLDNLDENGQREVVAILDSLGHNTEGYMEAFDKAKTTVANTATVVVSVGTGGAAGAVLGAIRTASVSLARRELVRQTVQLSTRARMGATVLATTPTPLVANTIIDGDHFAEEGFINTAAQDLAIGFTEGALVGLVGPGMSNWARRYPGLSTPLPARTERFLARTSAGAAEGALGAGAGAAMEETFRFLNEGNGLDSQDLMEIQDAGLTGAAFGATIGGTLGMFSRSDPSVRNIGNPPRVDTTPRHVHVETPESLLAMDQAGSQAFYDSLNNSSSRIRLTGRGVEPFKIDGETLGIQINSYRPRRTMTGDGVINHPDLKGLLGQVRANNARLVVVPGRAGDGDFIRFLPDSRTIIIGEATTLEAARRGIAEATMSRLSSFDGGVLMRTLHVENLPNTRALNGIDVVRQYMGSGDGVVRRGFQADLQRLSNGSRRGGLELPIENRRLAGRLRELTRERGDSLSERDIRFLTNLADDISPPYSLSLSGLPGLRPKPGINNVLQLFEAVTQNQLSDEVADIVQDSFNHAVLPRNIEKINEIVQGAEIYRRGREVADQVTGSPDLVGPDFYRALAQADFEAHPGGATTNLYRSRFTATLADYDPVSAEVVRLLRRGVSGVPDRVISDEMVNNAFEVVAAARMGSVPDDRLLEVFGYEGFRQDGQLYMEESYLFADRRGKPSRKPVKPDSP